MKAAVYFSWMGWISLLVGCSTPLMIQHGGQEIVAPRLGLAEEDIQFLRPVFYNDKPVEGRPRAYQGIIVVTESEVHIIDGYLEALLDRDPMKISIEDIEGLYLNKEQLQIKLGEERIVLWVVNSRPGYDKRGTRLLNDLLISKGVSEWRSDKM